MAKSEKKEEKDMFKVFLFITLCCLILSCSKTRTLSMETYVDKMKGGWVGQMVGVGWGGPTEFKYQGEIIPANQIPQWRPEMVNQHYQDDIYVEMTFLATLEKHDFDASIRQAGIDFANSQYMLWHANKAGRDNLRSGIAPPYSGHPQFNSHADDIDYQIEADFSGLIAPGMPQIVIELGEKFGRLMNYGDGLYGGQFVGGMYAEAFFQTNMEQIIEAGLACIPAQSQYAECIRDVLQWYHQNPDDWQATWKLINAKYHLNPQYRKFSCSGAESKFNIDAKINGAYIVMGMLYGKGDPDSTVIIATRCGQDSDCNPSNAAGILFTTIGFSNLPERFTSAIDETPIFSYTEYNFASLIDVCAKLARQAVLRAGGRVQKNDGENFIIPVSAPVIGTLEQCWDVQQVTEDVHFTNEEMKQIQFRARPKEDFVVTWQMAGPFMKEGLTAQELLETKFAPETTQNASVKWQKMPMSGNEEIVLLDYPGGENRVAYLRNRIWSEIDREVRMEVGSDDGIKIWINNALVHSNNVTRGLNNGEDKVQISLKKGWNNCLMKVSQGSGGWGASVCFADPETGETLKDLKFE
jgi:hypothetical protein